MNFTMDVPGLEDVKITKMEQVEDRVALHMELEIRTHRCTRCQEKPRRVHVTASKKSSTSNDLNA